MNVHKIAIIIFCAINLRLVEAKFFIETDDYPFCPPIEPDAKLQKGEAVFLYRGSKIYEGTHDDGVFRVYKVNLERVTKSEEKRDIYMTANFYEVFSAEFMHGHNVHVNGKYCTSSRTNFRVGFLPKPKFIVNPTLDEEQGPDFQDFPILDLASHYITGGEIRAGRIGIAHIVPFMNEDAMQDLTDYLLFTDIAIFWIYPNQINFMPKTHNTFQVILSNFIKIYFDQVHRTPEMKRNNKYPDYVRPMAVQELKPKKKWEQGVKDIQQAVEATMNHLIDPCAIYVNEPNRFFDLPKANQHCRFYCKYLKAAFLVHDIAGDCSTIDKEAGYCKGSVCTCWVLKSSGCGFFKSNVRAIPMHYCNNNLRLAIKNRQQKKEKEAELADKRFRKISDHRDGRGSPRVAETEYTYEHPLIEPDDFEYSPGSSPPAPSNQHTPLRTYSEHFRKDKNETPPSHDRRAPYSPGNPHEKRTPYSLGQPHERRTPPYPGNPQDRRTPYFPGNSHEKKTPYSLGQPHDRMTPPYHGNSLERNTPKKDLRGASTNRNTPRRSTPRESLQPNGKSLSASRSPKRSPTNSGRH